MILYHICVFGVDWKFNMAARANNVFWLAEILKIFSSETRRHNEFLLCMDDVLKILYKISIFRADHATNMEVLV